MVIQIKSINSEENLTTTADSAANTEAKPAKPKRKIKEKLGDFCVMYRDAFGMDDQKHERAAEFFGVPADTCKAWYDETPLVTAHRLLQVHHAGYLPFANGAWSQYRIDADGVLHTPFGSCTSGDIAMLWRYKWSGAAANRSLQAAKAQIREMQSTEKMQQLLSTAASLNQLLMELTGS